MRVQCTPHPRAQCHHFHNRNKRSNLEPFFWFMVVHSFKLPIFARVVFTRTGGTQTPPTRNKRSDRTLCRFKIVHFSSLSNTIIWSVHCRVPIDTFKLEVFIMCQCFMKFWHTRWNFDCFSPLKWRRKRTSKQNIERYQQFWKNWGIIWNRQGGWEIQLDWASYIDTQKINLPWDREGYGGFEYTDEKLSTRRIHWWCAKIHIFFFGELFLKHTAWWLVQYEPTKN